MRQTLRDDPQFPAGRQRATPGDEARVAGAGEGGQVLLDPEMAAIIDSQLKNQEEIVPICKVPSSHRRKKNRRLSLPLSRCEID